jgi:hypothetical protein
MTNASLETVNLKLARAQKHLDEITMMLASLEYGECRIIPEYSQDRELVVQRIHITPKPTLELSAAVGDCLFAMRSALDHLVWQLVICNGESPTNDNMFPITTSADNFLAARKRKRLQGVSAAAEANIEGLQPYHLGNAALERLDTLHNMDKHRTLILTTVVADNTCLRYCRDGAPVLDMFLGDEELRDGSVFGEIGIPINDPELIEMFPHIAKTISQMEVRGNASLFISFQESDVESLEEHKVSTTLQGILKFIKGSVIPRFDTFFCITEAVSESSDGQSS